MPPVSADRSRHSNPGSVGVTATQSIELLSLPLESGGVLAPVRVAFERYGLLSPARDNVILICHALSGDAHAAGWSATPDEPATVDGFGADEGGGRPQPGRRTLESGVRNPRSGLGWWDNLIGPGKAFDTDRYHVICSNLIGSCRGSSGPTSLNPMTGKPYGTDFPVVTVGDMVRAQRALLDALGINKLLAVAGGSLGGMQALEWSVAYPEIVQSCVLTASTACLGAQGIALNAIARAAIMADPDWQGGHYYGTGRQPLAGIGVARMIGHITYLSAESLDQKFGRVLQDRSDISYTLEETDFAVESYLRYQARAFADRFDANSYLYISRALTYFDLARTHGGGSLAAAIEQVQARYLLLSFTSDWIYPTANAVSLEAALRSAGKDVIRHEIATSYGHDSFLLEDVEQSGLIAGHLAETSDKNCRVAAGDQRIPGPGERNDLA